MSTTSIPTPRTTPTTPLYRTAIFSQEEAVTLLPLPSTSDTAAPSAASPSPHSQQHLSAEQRAAQSRNKLQRQLSLQQMNDMSLNRMLETGVYNTLQMSLISAVGAATGDSLGADGYVSKGWAPHNQCGSFVASLGLGGAGDKGL
jgi:hypothetical protein